MSRRGLAIAAALLAVGLGAAIGSGRGSIAVLILAPIAIASLVPSDALRVTVLLGATSSFVFAWAAPSVAVGPVQVYAAELVLLAALMSAALAQGRSGFARRSADPITWLFCIYAIGLLIGVVVSLFARTELSLVVAGVRAGIFIVGFYVFRMALSEPRARAMSLLLLSCVAVVVVVGQVVQIALGPSRLIFVVGPFADLVASDVTSGFLRVRPPGLYLVYVAAAMSASYVFWGPRRLRRWAILVLLASTLGVALSLNRNMMVGLVAGLYLAFVFVRGRSRILMATGISLVVVLIVAATVGGGFPSSPVVGRFATLADANARSVALADRMYESGLAFAAASSSPVFGIGWGTPYGASATRLFEGIVASRNRDYVHNQYLAAWLRMGIAGLVGFVGLIAFTILSGIRAGADSHSAEDRWLGPATISAMTALATSAAVDMVILSPSNVGVFAFVAALGSALWSSSRHRTSEEQ